MKFYETHYEDYLTREAEISLHPKLDNIYKTFPDNIKDFKNLIFYGPRIKTGHGCILKLI